MTLSALEAVDLRGDSERYDTRFVTTRLGAARSPLSHSPSAAAAATDRQARGASPDERSALFVLHYADYRSGTARSDTRSIPHVYVLRTRANAQRMCACEQRSCRRRGPTPSRSVHRTPSHELAFRYALTPAALLAFGLSGALRGRCTSAPQLSRVLRRRATHLIECMHHRCLATNAQGFRVVVLRRVVTDLLRFPEPMLEVMRCVSVGVQSLVCICLAVVGIAGCCR